MKNLKNLLFTVIGVVSIGFMTTSCNDKFSEKDLLELQIQLGTQEDSLNAVRQLAALNAAGELVSFQVKIVDTDGVGIAGLDVTLGAAASDGTADNQTLVTDANGSVYFNRVAIGGNNLNITGTAITDANLTLDFGNIQEGVHYIRINNNIVPQPVTENAVITVLSTATSTATVQGTAIIETDVTNTTAEIPQNLVLRANFDDNLVVNSSIGIGYFFATNSSALDLGMAAVDNATGAYSMTVPAGVNFDIIIPDLQATQRIAVNDINNQMLPRPEYRDIATNFGNTYNTDNNTPVVNGAFVIFDAPPVPGDGFTFGSIARRGRSIQTFSLNNAMAPIPWTEPFEPSADIITQVTSLGSTHQTSPTVTVTDAGSGTGATMDAYLEYVVSTVTVSTIATGYGNNAPETIQIRYFDNQTVPVSQDAFTPLAVTTSATGEITQTEVDAGIAAANTNSDPGFGGNYQSIPGVSTSMEIVFPAGGAGDGVGTVAINGRVRLVTVTNGGSGYTGPIFTFTGGGATTQFAMSVLEFGTTWDIDVDNAGITTPYPLLPATMQLEYNEITIGNGMVMSSLNPANVSTGAAASPFADLLTVDGSGNIQWVDQTSSYRTNFNSHVMPRVIIIQNSATIAAVSGGATIDVNDGSVTNIGGIGNTGNGYLDLFGILVEPSATGAPGTGAIVQMTGGDHLTTGEFQWAGGHDITNGGSAFLQDLNQVNGDRGFEVNGSSGTGGYSNINLQAGDTHIADIDFGTGVRSAVIN